MFGESDSESPRTGSPWDGLLSRSDPTSPTEENSLARSPKVIPKLVPEIEQGNVEYKLRLLNPTAERFTRLVTQLKWRLLEGGGQAYYELGVADSGQLVGLSRIHLEQTLQTLEEMAGEIGASVIIVKEIEVPATLLEKTETHGRIADGAMRMHKKRFEDFHGPSSVGESTSACTTDCDEAELSTPEAESDGYGLEEAGVEGYHRTHPERTSAQSSPFLKAVEDQYDSASGDESWVFSGELEIATVYKPRPQRRRTPNLVSSPKRSFMNVPPSISAPLDVPSRTTADGNERSTGRDRWIRHKRNGRKARARVPIVTATDEGLGLGSFPRTRGMHADLDDCPSSFDDLAEAAALLSIHDDSAVVPSAIPALYEPVASLTIDALKSVKPSNDPAERRFIVEALVVRKMSLEEAFLDFGSL